MGGCDFLIGSKIPIYMKQLGLVNVNVRVNDFVEFVSPRSNIPVPYCASVASFNCPLLISSLIPS